LVTQVTVFDIPFWFTDSFVMFEPTNLTDSRRCEVERVLQHFCSLSMNGMQILATLCYAQAKMIAYLPDKVDLMHYALQAARVLFPMYFSTSSKVEQ
jgi:hypothetical protein